LILSIFILKGHGIVLDLDEYLYREFKKEKKT